MINFETFLFTFCHYLLLYNIIIFLNIFQIKFSNLTRFYLKLAGLTKLQRACAHWINWVLCGIGYLIPRGPIVSLDCFFVGDPLLANFFPPGHAHYLAIRFTTYFTCLCILYDFINSHRIWNIATRLFTLNQTTLTRFLINVS